MGDDQGTKPPVAGEQTPEITKNGPDGPAGSVECEATHQIEQKTPSPLDALFITPEEEAQIKQTNAERDTQQAIEEPVEAITGDAEQGDESGPMLAEEVQKICRAIDRLARKGLNLKAIIALLHDSNPTIPKKSIKTIIEGLRELPAIYGRDQRSSDPLRRS